MYHCQNPTENPVCLLPPHLFACAEAPDVFWYVLALTIVQHMCVQQLFQWVRKVKVVHVPSTMI